MREASNMGLVSEDKESRRRLDMLARLPNCRPDVGLLTEPDEETRECMVFRGWCSSPLLARAEDELRSDPEL